MRKMRTVDAEKEVRTKAPFLIEGFTSRPGLGMGQYGIKATLRGDIALALSKMKRPNDAPLIAWMKEEVGKHGEIRWHNDSWLLWTLMLNPSQCSCFGFDGNTKEHIDGRDIAYQPHNIDSSHQAAQLLSVWLLWINHMAVQEVNGELLIEHPWAV